MHEELQELRTKSCTKFNKLFPPRSYIKSRVIPIIAPSQFPHTRSPLETLAEEEMAVKAITEEVEIIKPRNDKRDYRRILLPNNLLVLLISDPETDKVRIHR